MPCLVFKDRQGRRMEVAIDKPRLSVGREAGNDIVIPFRSVSRTHCAFEVRADEVWVRDVGSSNGSKLNEEPLTEPQRLEHKDRIQIGEFGIRYYETSRYPDLTAGAQPDGSRILFADPTPPAGGGARVLLALGGGYLLGAASVVGVIAILVIAGILKLP